MATKHIFLRLLLAIMALTAVSCGQKQSTRTVSAGATRYAELLTIVPSDGFTRVEVRTKAGEKPVASYILIPRGGKRPAELPQGDVIEVPVRSLVVNSSVYASPMIELGIDSVIKGVTDAGYFTMPVIKAGLSSGRITDVGNAQSPSVEKIVELSPDGILINLFEGMNAAELPTTGVPYIKFADNLESTPLGRAEWIKFLGILTGKSAEADSIFNFVEKRYLELSDLTSGITSRPKVLTENMYEGVWYVPGGGSMAARMLEDAGAYYPWSDTKNTGSLALSFEEVLEKGGDADVWLMKVFGQKLTDKSLIATDSRYSVFRPLKEHHVWYSDTSTSGLYDFSAFHPEILLRDYIIIFHPELMPGERPRFFEPVSHN